LQFNGKTWKSALQSGGKLKAFIRPRDLD